MYDKEMASNNNAFPKFLLLAVYMLYVANASAPGNGKVQVKCTCQVS